jgi:hypothetical protein
MESQFVTTLTANFLIVAIGLTDLFGAQETTCVL